jgi:hypothetical protein
VSSAPSEILLFRDATALAHYLAGAAQWSPGLLERPCVAFELAPENGTPTEAPWTIALKLEHAPDGAPVPRPPEAAQERARLVPAEVDLDAKRLRVLAPARGLLRRPSVVETFAIERARASSNVVQAAPLEPWTREPDDPEVAFLSPMDETFAALVTEHLELGRDALRFAATVDPKTGPQVLVDVGRPSWFLLERWSERRTSAGEPAVVAFRRLPRRRIYIAWGYRHPLESFLAEPEGDALLFIDADGRYRTLRAGSWKDVSEVLSWEKVALASDALEPAPEPGRIPVRLRLERRPRPRDPELWLLPAEERSRLERLLAQTPEEELKNLLVSLVTRPDGSRVFVVREVLAGRAARLLPIGGQGYAAIPGLPNLFVPCELTIAPPLRNDRYARAFSVKAGEITLLDEQASGIRTTRVDEASFRPIDAVVDFVVSGDADRLQAVVLAAPFELGRFAEEDLVPPGAPPERSQRRSREPKATAPETSETPVVAELPESSRSAAKPTPPKDREPSPRERTHPPREEDARARAVATLERELAENPGDLARWERLALVAFEDKDEEEALRATENALWLARTPQEEQPLKAALAERLGALAAQDPKRAAAPPADASGIYRAVFAYASRAPALQDPEVYRARTGAVHELLRSQEGVLRKKGRWLLWREVLRATGDRVEEERQREDILSELVLRGVEDREVPAFVRRRLLERYSSATLAGSARPPGKDGRASSQEEALDFLKDAEAFADAADKPAFRADAVAHVAWAYAELGQAERARELARTALRHAAEARSDDQAPRARALARAAAVIERADGPGAGTALFREALELIDRGLKSRPERSFDERKALTKWFIALADARGIQAQTNDSLVQEGLRRLEEVDPSQRALALDECADAIARLGQGPRGRTMARALLARNDLRLLQHEHAIAALDTFEEGRPVAPEDGRKILDVILRSPPDEFPEYLVPAVKVGLRSEPRAPWEVAEELAANFAKQNHGYHAQLVRVALLERLAELKERDRGPRLLAKAFEDAWAHQGDPKGEERMRLLVRLAKLVPAFGLREKGLELLRRVKDRAKDEKSLNVQNDLLSECALASAKLGETRETMRVIEEITETVLARFREARRDQTKPSSILFEALESAALGAAEVGDAPRGLALVDKVAAAAREALAHSIPTEPGRTGDAGRFYFYRAIIRCGRAAVALGHREAAQAYFDDALKRLADTFGHDRIDLLWDMAKAANELDGAARYELASRVLKLARGVLDMGELSRQFAVDLAERVAQDVVRGESAFAAALKRWKGEEERRIRDRVVTERVCENPWES